tara:strand:- start:830 stop:940 length:111 start_codon:yes stop_codon:yes gene_type:complete
MSHEDKALLIVTTLVVLPTTFLLSMLIIAIKTGVSL